MTEAGTHIGSGGPVPLPRSLPSERPAYRGPEARLERLHAYFLEGCTDEIRPVLESVPGDARRVHAGYADDEVGDGLASGLVCRDCNRRAGCRPRARRSRRARCGRGYRRSLRAAAVRRTVCPLPRGRRKPKAARAPASRRDRAAARPPLRSRRSRRRLALDANLVRARVHRRAGRRHSAEPTRSRRGEGDASRTLSAVSAGWLAATRCARPSLWRGIRGRRGTHRFGGAERGRRVPQRDSGGIEPGNRTRALARALGEPRAHVDRVGRAPVDASGASISTTDRSRTCSRWRRRSAPSAAGVPVHPRGLSRAGARSVRRPVGTAGRARSPASRDRPLARDEERHLAPSRGDPPPRDRHLRRAHRESRRSSRSVATPTRSPPHSESQSSARFRRRSRTSASTPARPT